MKQVRQAWPLQSVCPDARSDTGEGNSEPGSAGGTWAGRRGRALLLSLCRGHLCVFLSEQLLTGAGDRRLIKPQEGCAGITFPSCRQTRYKKGKGRAGPSCRARLSGQGRQMVLFKAQAPRARERSCRWNIAISRDCPSGGGSEQGDHTLVGERSDFACGEGPGDCMRPGKGWLLGQEMCPGKRVLNGVFLEGRVPQRCVCGHCWCGGRSSFDIPHWGHTNHSHVKLSSLLRGPASGLAS